MKKLFSLFVILVLASCSDDVKFNNPGFQGYRDDILFRSINTQAFESTSGAVNIQALAQDESVNLFFTSANVGTYSLGTSNANNRATYFSNFGGNELSYATDPTPGQVSTIEKPFISGGSNYTPDCTVDNAGQTICTMSHATTTTGSGSGLTVSISTTNGVVTDARVASPGDFYSPGDVVTIVGGDNNASFRISNSTTSNGFIEITENIGGTITGTFQFNAVKNNVNPFANDVINFEYGAFYKIRLTPAP